MGLSAVVIPDIIRRVNNNFISLCGRTTILHSEWLSDKICDQHSFNRALTPFLIKYNPFFKKRRSLNHLISEITISQGAEGGAVCGGELNTFEPSRTRTRTRTSTGRLLAALVFKLDKNGNELQK